MVTGYVKYQRENIVGGEGAAKYACVGPRPPTPLDYMHNPRLFLARYVLSVYSLCLISIEICYQQLILCLCHISTSVHDWKILRCLLSTVSYQSLHHPILSVTVPLCHSFGLVDHGAWYGSCHWRGFGHTFILANIW